MIETERIKDRSLPIIHVAEDSGGCGLVFASPMNDEKFPYCRKLLQGFVNTDVQPGLMKLPLKQRGKRQCQDAIEGVNADFLISPMEHRLPRNKMRVFHGPESALNSVLSPISQHDVLIGPIVAVREYQCFAEEGAAKPVNSGSVDVIGQAGQLAPAMGLQRDGEDFVHMARGKNGIYLFLRSAECGWLARFGLSPDPAVEPPLHFMELPSALLDLLHEGCELFRVEVVVEGHQDRALDTKDFFFGPVGGNRFEAFPCESLKIFAVHGQKFRVVRGNQRADKSIWAVLQKIHPFFRVVSLIEDKCDLGTPFGECGIALHQLVEDAAELDRIWNIPIVRMMEQGDMKISGNQKGQADLAKIVAPVLVMSPSRKFPFGARTDKSEEVCGIKREAAQVKLVDINHPAAKIDLDSTDLFLPQVAHVIPKPLASQLVRFGRTQAPEDGLSVPGRQLAFAPGACGAVDGSQRDVVAYGKSLFPFRDVGIDSLNELELLDDAPNRSDRAEFGDGDLSYRGRTPGFCNCGHNVFYPAEVDRARDLGPAIDPAAFPGIIVRMSTNNLFCEACHIRS